MHLYYKVQIVCVSAIHAVAFKDPQTHIYMYVYIYMYIYLESILPGERYKHIYMATPLSVLKNIYTKNGTSARKKKLSYRPKILVCTQLHSANNIWWVPSGYSSSCLCVRLIILIMVLQKNYFDLITYSLLFYKSTIYASQSRQFCD